MICLASLTLSRLTRRLIRLRTGARLRIQLLPLPRTINHRTKWILQLTPACYLWRRKRALQVPRSRKLPSRWRTQIRTSWCRISLHFRTLVTLMTMRILLPQWTNLCRQNKAKSARLINHNKLRHASTSRIRSFGKRFVSMRILSQLASFKTSWLT